MVATAPEHFLYRPVSLTTRQGTPRGRGAPHGGRGSEVVGTPGAVRDGAPRPGAQAALLRPGLLRDGSRAAVATGLADGVPARGDPTAARLRGVRVPRPVGDRAAHRRHGGRRVPERVPPPWREGRPGQWDLRQRVPVPVPRVVLRARRHEHRGHAAADVRRAQPASPTTSTSRRSGARCGAGARGSTSTPTPRRYGNASSPRRPTSTRGRWSRCGPRSGTRAASR